MPRTTLIAAALLGLAFAANAEPLPHQQEFYFDADAAALRPILVLKETDAAAVERLMRQVERKPEAVLESAQLGHYGMTSNQRDVARTYYGRALARLDFNNGLWRPVKWTYGWDLYRAGDPAAALDQWSELANRGVTAGWMPPTFALALWKLGRRDEAIRWYAAAVRTEPHDWSSSDRFGQLLPQWSEDERAQLAAVQAAWAANPPAWH